ncbi:MAG: hypothetical protein AUI16_23345 [Alphaproteobacteria bacterium 13_2_20CM_2_64_7]|nr:MAG: hypothetical protein AUI16_23345 [Alphaproteobacteria bacterium 13_2_20CM_2_64_7]
MLTASSGSRRSMISTIESDLPSELSTTLKKGFGLGPLWVIRDREGRNHTLVHVRFAPKADIV